MANNLNDTPRFDGRTIKLILAAMDLDSYELAQMLELEGATISNVLNGKRKNPVTINRIANTLGERVRSGIVAGLIQSA